MDPVMFVPGRGGGAIDMTVNRDPYIESCTIVKTEQFFIDIANILREKFGIYNLVYNNTRSSFWHRLIKD